MRGPAAAAAVTLERLGHHDVLDAPQGSGGAGGWNFRQALGGRRLSNFRAIHHDELARALASLPPGKDAETAALRGRLLRLLGDSAGARRAFAASSAAAPNARAAGWLGEMSVGADPRRAVKLLDRAASLDPSWPWPRLWKAAALLRLGKGAAAGAELDAFSRLSRERPFVFGVLRFQARMLARDRREALSEAEAAIRRDPSSPAGYEAAGLALQSLGRERAALARVHEARDLDFDVTGSFVYESSRFEIDWRKPETLLAHLDAAIAARPRVAALYAERAEFKRLPRVCLYEEALADYAKAVSLEPRRAWLRAALARAKNNQLGGRAGLSDFDRAVRLAPRAGWIRAWRGAVLSRLGEREKALSDFAAARRLMPWYGFTYAWRGALLNRMKDFAGARRDLDTALRLEPSYAFSVYERFRALRGLKDYAGAVRDLNAAFAADPKYVWGAEGLPELDAAVKAHPELGWLRAWRGHCLLELGRPKEALADFDRALTRERGSGLILAWRGRARHAAGRGAGALADLKEAVRRSPRLWTARLALSELHESRGETAQALRRVSEASRLAPTTVFILAKKARLELDLGRAAAAAASAGRALELDGSSAAARALLGRALIARGTTRQKSGDARGSIADFRRALELSPELFPTEQRRAVSRLTGSGA